MFSKFHKFLTCELLLQFYIQKGREILYYSTGVTQQNCFCEILESDLSSNASCKLFTRKQVMINWMKEYLKFMD